MNEKTESLNAFEKPFRCRRQKKKKRRRYRGERLHAELVTLAGGTITCRVGHFGQRRVLKYHCAQMPKRGEDEVPHELRQPRFHREEKMKHGNVMDGAMAGERLRLERAAGPAAHPVSGPLSRRSGRMRQRTGGPTPGIREACRNVQV